MKIIAKNKKALFNYEVLKRLTAGIQLYGWEVKSIKKGNISLKESYVTIRKEEVFLVGAHVSAWPGMAKPAPDVFDRDKKLLLNRSEITHLQKGRDIKGQTIVVTNIHLDHGKIKVEIALARGKKLFDKRQKEKEKDQKKEIARDLKYIKRV